MLALLGGEIDILSTGIVEALGYKWPRFHIPQSVAYAFAYLGDLRMAIGEAKISEPDR